MDILVRELERRFSQLTSSCYPHEWDENHITFSLMREMRETFTRREVHYNGFTKIIDWFSYKNKSRTVESAIGDISLLVNIQFSSGEVLRGVAFLEAKRDCSKDNFQSLSLDQIQRIHANAPYAHLLLYLHETQAWPLKFPDQTTWQSSIWASPINTVVRKLPQISTADNWKTLRVALPFSMLITSRFFWGHDLDYRTEAFELALKGLGEFAPPQFLGVINIYYEGQSPLNVDIADTWEPI